MNDHFYPCPKVQSEMFRGGEEGSRLAYRYTIIFEDLLFEHQFFKGMIFCQVDWWPMGSEVRKEGGEIVLDNDNHPLKSP